MGCCSSAKLARASSLSMISFTLPNGAEFSFPVEWWNEVGMPAFERQSPYYLWDALPELFVRIDAIEPPPMDYEGLDHVRMVSVASRDCLPNCAAARRSRGAIAGRLSLSTAPRRTSLLCVHRCWLHAHSRSVAALIPSPRFLDWAETILTAWRLAASPVKWLGAGFRIPPGSIYLL
jgi:hypothetical protein